MTPSAVYRRVTPSIAVLALSISLLLFCVEPALGACPVADGDEPRDCGEPELTEPLVCETIDQDINQAISTYFAFGNAARDGNLAEVQRFVACGLSLEGFQGIVEPALLFATGSNQVEVMEFLLCKGANANVTTRAPVLGTAARNGFTEAVEVLLDNCANIDGIDSRRRETALIIAVANGHLDIVELLVERGASVDVPNVFFQTPLQVAVESCSPDMVKVLVKGGADVKQTTFDEGLTMIQLLAKSGCTQKQRAKISRALLSGRFRKTQG